MTETERGTRAAASPLAIGAEASNSGPGTVFARALRRVPVSGRVWTLSALLLALAAALFLAFLHGHQAHEVPTPVPWYLVALGFFAAELKVIDVHFRREKHSFSLTEFPAVLGFFLLPPDEYVLALVVGTAGALLVERQPPVKIAFNLANSAFTATAALTVFYALQVSNGTPDPMDWVAAFAATLLAAVLSAGSIAIAISLSGGAPQFEKLPEMIQFGGLVAVANTSLALLAVSVLWLDPRLLWLLVVPMVTSSSPTGPTSPSVRSTSGSSCSTSPAASSSDRRTSTPPSDALLEHAREMFRAERAEVLLWPRDGDGDGLLTTSDPGAADQDDGARCRWPKPTRSIAGPGRSGRSFLYIAPARGDEPDPARDGRPAPRRVGDHRLDGHRQPAHGGDDLRATTTCGSSRRSPTRRRSPSRTASWSSP